jgi:hypothetical protein
MANIAVSTIISTARMNRHALLPRMNEPNAVRSVNSATAMAKHAQPTPETPACPLISPAAIRITAIRNSSDCQYFPRAERIVAIGSWTAIGHSHRS